MSILIYRVSDGKPLRLHSGSRTALVRAKARVKDGEAYLEGEFDTIEGKRVENGQLVDAEKTRDEALREIREIRFRLFKESDWTTGDAPLKNRAEWQEYRQALRDMTKGDPFNPVWPKRPDK